jgi:hypothetical protein
MRPNVRIVRAFLAMLLFLAVAYPCQAVRLHGSSSTPSGGHGGR